MARQHLARLADGLYDLRADSAVAEQLLTTISDPIVRTGWGNTHGYSLTLQSRYAEARETLLAALEDIDRFDLEFGRPHIQWTLAAAELGLRRFSRAEGFLTKVEQAANDSNDPHLHLNTRALRARLFLTQQRVSEAVAVTADDFIDYSTRAMYGEYVATRGLALGIAGDKEGAIAAASAATRATRAVETRVLAAAALAVAAVGTPNALPTADNLVATARTLSTWDGVVCAARASSDLLQRISSLSHHRVQLTQLFLRSNDFGLAQSVGLISRRPYGRHGVLSRRESEVLDLLGQGLRNRQIASTLYISEATVKVHVRHILEKLNAHTRAEAVARYVNVIEEATDERRENS
jgi:DNA-binding NarL/FixJ family response regulator